MVDWAKRELTLYDACAGADDEAFAFGAAAVAFLGGIVYERYGIVEDSISFRTRYWKSKSDVVVDG